MSAGIPAEADARRSRSYPGAFAFSETLKYRVRVIAANSPVALLVQAFRIFEQLGHVSWATVIGKLQGSACYTRLQV